MGYSSEVSLGVASAVTPGAARRATSRSDRLLGHEREGSHSIRGSCTLVTGGVASLPKVTYGTPGGWAIVTGDLIAVATRSQTREVDDPREVGSTWNIGATFGHVGRQW